MDNRAEEIVLPWDLYPDEQSGYIFVVDAEKQQVVRFSQSQDEVAKRVVACVNACRGISTEELMTSDFGEDSVEVGTLLGQTMQQRDDLLESLRKIVRGLEINNWSAHKLSDPKPMTKAEIAREAKFAIAKATGSVITDSDGGHCD